MTPNWQRLNKFGFHQYIRKINGRVFCVRQTGSRRERAFVCIHPDGWVLADGLTADAVMLQADLVIQHALEGTIV